MRPLTPDQWEALTTTFDSAEGSLEEQRWSAVHDEMVELGWYARTEDALAVHYDATPRGYVATRAHRAYLASLTLKVSP